MEQDDLTCFLVHGADRTLHLSVQRLDGKNVRPAGQQVADLVGGETSGQLFSSGV